MRCSAYFNSDHLDKGGGSRIGCNTRRFKIDRRKPQEWTGKPAIDNANPDYSYDKNNHVLTIKSGKAMTISSHGASTGGVTHFDRIEVDADGVEVNLTFDGLKINRGASFAVGYILRKKISK